MILLFFLIEALQMRMIRHTLVRISYYVLHISI
jgi:hypothetical protein